MSQSSNGIPSAFTSCTASKTACRRLLYWPLESVWVAVPSPRQLTMKPASPAAAALRTSASIVAGSSWVESDVGTSVSWLPG